VSSRRDDAEDEPTDVRSADSNRGPGPMVVHGPHGAGRSDSGPRGVAAGVNGPEQRAVVSAGSQGRRAPGAVVEPLPNGGSGHAAKGDPASGESATGGSATGGSGSGATSGGPSAGASGNGVPAKTVTGAVVEGVKEAGAPVVRFLDLVGGHLLLVARALAWLPRRPIRGKNYLEAAEYIGFGSLPIVLLVGAFTGMVLSLQSVYAFGQLGFESFSGAATGKALSIELAPVLTSLMLAGRAGAGIATELGTMRITEQIDALESMAVNPIQYLVLPRLIAAMVVVPILALLFFVVGMGGAWLVAVLFEGVDQGQWVANLRDIVSPLDVIQGLIKSVFFGFLVVLIGCYQGFNASGGGRGVGMGTTRAVVIASVSTLIIDYFLSDILLALFGIGRG
jgi:phospholipid/cholesterol/gamma-HCH transport system permease protein